MNDNKWLGFWYRLFAILTIVSASGGAAAALDGSGTGAQVAFAFVLAFECWTFMVIARLVREWSPE